MILPKRMAAMAIIWLLTVLAITAVFLLRGTDAVKVETNLMALLPSVDRDELITRARQNVSAAVDQKLVFLLQADSLPAAKRVASEIRAITQESGLFSLVSVVDAFGKNHYQQLYPYRYQLLSQETHLKLQADPDDVVRQSLQALYGPVEFLRAASLAQDPLYLFGRYLEQMVPQGGRIEDGFIIPTTGDVHAAIFIAELNRGAFVVDQQGQLLSLVEELQQQQAEAGRHLYVSGLPLYAADGARRAQSEIKLIGVGSAVGVCLLLIVIFASIRPLLLALLAVGVGVFGAWTVSGLIFSQLHILTLVFGASLIGVAVDYCLHYFCGLYAKGGHQGEARRSVVQGITLALVTSSVAYLCLSVAPFPGLRQMAVFSATGLFFSWLTVVALFPMLLRSSQWPEHPRLWRALDLFVGQGNGLMAGKSSLLLASFLLLGVGTVFLHGDDDVRNMQSPDSRLLQQDRHIQQLMPTVYDSRFFVVKGVSQQQVLAREAELRLALDSLVANGSIDGYQAIGQQYVPVRQQQDNYQLLADTLYNSQRLRSYLSALGFNELAIDREYQQFADAIQQQLSLDGWLAAVPEYWKDQWLGCSNGYCGVVVRLERVSDFEQLAALADIDGVALVDTVGQTSQLMADYREYASWLLALGIFLALILLVWFRGWRKGLMGIFIPLGAIVVTLGVLGWLGEGISLFRVFALLLVLGIGADFGIFATQQNRLSTATALAIVLSAATTLLAFGLLSLSDTEVVRAFGQTLLIGIACAFLLVPVISRLQGFTVSSKGKN